jgi:hypothetical protein
MEILGVFYEKFWVMEWEDIDDVSEHPGHYSYFQFLCFIDPGIFYFINLWDNAYDLAYETNTLTTACS